MFVPNLKILGQVVPEKPLSGKKYTKYTNKHCYGKDKKIFRTSILKINEYRFCLTQFNESYPMFVPNLKILGQVVPEKPFSGKKLHKIH